jgi:hypothetical protein
MTALKLFKTDWHRQWLAHTAVSGAALVAGASAAFAARTQARLSEQLNPPTWGASVALLPKGVTLEALNEDLQRGHARALLPKALFETINAQIADEQARRGLAQPSLSLFAVLPSEKAATMVLGKLPENSKPWSTVRSMQWQAAAGANSTPEWGTQVVEAIFATGAKDAALSLKQLADRRTVAQAFLIDEEVQSERTKAAGILAQMWAAVTMVLLSGGMTLILALRMTAQQRRNLFQVLEILGGEGSLRVAFAGLQFAAYIAAPLLLGVFIGTFL